MSYHPSHESQEGGRSTYSNSSNSCHSFIDQDIEMHPSDPYEQLANMQKEISDLHKALRRSQAHAQAEAASRHRAWDRVSELEHSSTPSQDRHHQERRSTPYSVRSQHPHSDYTPNTKRNHHSTSPPCCRHEYMCFNCHTSPHRPINNPIPRPIPNAVQRQASCPVSHIQTAQNAPVLMENSLAYIHQTILSPYEVSPPSYPHQEYPLLETPLEADSLLRSSQTIGDWPSARRVQYLHLAIHGAAMLSLPLPPGC
ncbi:hypothetical protein Moror_11217 [Moniliophthora roreri MCA 2997]|uniref:Uncharacterized protein n=1 Tax=Moniliophthora roreri (strain MCA 2997) TaxID=1381753 RepID=V2WR07_MONRO|nr:hypothetical protein Moror_11217 [Moniliophthora roreri MCA 2997]